jgi:glutathione synthase/RimK-type ligase-like ATP-grasp enzyme
MKKIGILFGVENSFPSALVERINIRTAQGARNAEGIQAEFVLTGAVSLERAAEYAVIVDRISHDVPFYRALLKQAALNGSVVINDPLRAAADDKFLNYALARHLGVAVPATVLLPHKELPNSTSPQSMRNLEFPLDWESVFRAAGEHGFLKPINGGGWRDVHEVRGREEFFAAYDRSRDLCMVYQKAVEFTEYYRCYVVGRKTVRVMDYDPRRPHAERCARTPARAMTFHARKLFKRMQDDAVKLCRALGYDLNSVEFAVENGVPYAIDFMNPVPDADVHSVGEANFEWIVEQTAALAMAWARVGARSGAKFAESTAREKRKR